MEIRSLHDHAQADIRRLCATGLGIDLFPFNEFDLRFTRRDVAVFGDGKAAGVHGGTRDLEDAWNEWSLATNPNMTGGLVIAGRVKEAERLQKWIAGRTGIIEVQGDAPDEALAFLYASIVASPEQDRVAALSRCVSAVFADFWERRKLGSHGPLPEVVRGTFTAHVRSD